MAQTTSGETSQSSALPPEVRKRLSEERKKHQPEYNDTLAALKVMREHWHRWTILHKNDLKKLIHAKDTDFATLDYVYALLPARLSTAQESGITKDDWLIYQQRFTWQPYAKLARTARINNSLQKNQRDAGTQYIDKHIHEVFIEKRDIELSWSHPVAGHCLVLWASGKITDCEILGSSSLGSRKSTYNHTEVAPTFDELR